MQPRERQVRLRLPAGDRQDPDTGRPGLPSGAGQQRGLAHPGLAGDDQHLAGLRDGIQQSAQPGQPRVPANDPGGRL